MTVKDELLDELNRAFEEYREHFGDEAFYQLPDLINPLSISGPLAIDAIKRLREAIATDTPLPRENLPDDVVY